MSPTPFRAAKSPVIGPRSILQSPVAQLSAANAELPPGTSSKASREAGNGPRRPCDPRLNKARSKKTKKTDALPSPLIHTSPTSNFNSRASGLLWANTPYFNSWPWPGTDASYSLSQVVESKLPHYGLSFNSTLTKPRTSPRPQVR